MVVIGPKHIKVAFRIHFPILSPTIFVFSILINLFVVFTVQILLRLFITSNIFIHLTVLSLQRVKVETKQFFTYDNSLSVGMKVYTLGRYILFNQDYIKVKKYKTFLFSMNVYDSIVGPKVDRHFLVGQYFFKF